MSYARKNGRRWTKSWAGRIEPSDIYVIGTKHSLECLGCNVEESRYFSTLSRVDMLRHLQRHRRRGDRVPKHATRRLAREIKREGDAWAPSS